MLRDRLIGAAKKRHCGSERVFSAWHGAVLILSLLVATTWTAQMSSNAAPLPSTRQEGPSPAGMAAGPPQKAEFDSEHRPITAGGFVKNGPVIFLDSAEEAGLTTWRHTAGTPEKRFILEAKGLLEQCIEASIDASNPLPPSMDIGKGGDLK